MRTAAMIREVGLLGALFFSFLLLLCTDRAARLPGDVDAVIKVIRRNVYFGRGLHLIQDTGPLNQLVLVLSIHSYRTHPRS